MKSPRMISSVLAIAMSAACGQSAPPAAPASTAAVAPASTAAVAAPVAAEVEQTVAPVEEPAGDIQFEAALDLNQNPKPGAPQLRGGDEAKSLDWPASLYVTFKTGNGGMASCTAALLGPKVMLTAAHCVPSNGKVSFVYKGHAQPYTTTCQRHPRYPGDASSDFALCSVSPAFAEPANFSYETVNPSAMGGVVGQRITLTGFGCVSSVVGGSADGKYRIGSNSVDESSDSATKRRGQSFYVPRQVNNLFTIDDKNKANLCPGDSGGPAFMPSGGDVLSRRTIIGVNSRVFFADATGKTYGSSLISATGGPDFAAWARGWAKTAGVEACGIAGKLVRCRS